MTTPSSMTRQASFITGKKIISTMSWSLTVMAYKHIQQKYYDIYHTVAARFQEQERSTFPPGRTLEHFLDSSMTACTLGSGLGFLPFS
jgi:hypothetical protein